MALALRGSARWCTHALMGGGSQTEHTQVVSSDRKTVAVHPLVPCTMRHRLVLSVVDLWLIAVATLCAQLLRDSFETRPEQVLALLPYLGLTLAAAVPSLAAFRLNQSIWR